MKTNNITTKSTLSKTSAVKNRFKSFPPRLRIEAVIHDGQWYTIEKLAKISKTSVSEVNDFIDDVDYLIRENKSYRVSTSEVIKWYNDNGFDLEEPLIPANYTPKIWNGLTETEHLINAPRRTVSSLTITLDSSIEDKVKKILKGYGYLSYYGSDKHLFTTINSGIIKKKLQNELTPEEFQKLDIRLRNNYYRRHLSDFDQSFIENFFDFYIDFAFGALRSHTSTLDIFLSDFNEKRAQVIDWIVVALYKFDETACTPFSGYLSNVLQRWPYDLPVIELGKPLADFQKKRSNAINKLMLEHESEIITDDMIFNLLDYDLEEFNKLNNEHILWQKLKFSTTLQWEESGNDKKGNLIYENEYESKSTDYSPDLAHHITLALLLAYDKTKDIDSLINIIKNYGGLDFAKVKISDEFRLEMINNLDKNKLNELLYGAND